MSKKKKKVTKSGKASSHKKCAKCKRSKKLEEFGKNTRMKSGRKSYCKSCSRKAQHAWNEMKAAKLNGKKSKKKSSKKKKRNGKKTGILD